MLNIIRKNIQSLKSDKNISAKQLHAANEINAREGCIILAQSQDTFYCHIDNDKISFEFELVVNEFETITPWKNGNLQDWDAKYLAGLLLVEQYYKDLEEPPEIGGKVYTREGMMHRVWKEREEKASKAEYRITFADNIYGEHVLTTEQNVKYKITLRDFDKRTGYVNNIDWKTNKLGTTKHILFAFNALAENQDLYNELDKIYPFIEIYTDPLNDYRVTWHYPHELPDETADFLYKYFGDEKYVPEANLTDLLSFLQEEERFENILIRPEVYEKIDRAYREQSLAALAAKSTPDFSMLNVKPFPYQKEGIAFAAYKEGAIIADDMGLGKTLQAIGVSLVKKTTFDFKKTLIVCPASLKAQWKSEIEKFTNETAVVVEGNPQERKHIYSSFDGHFFITNYEAVLKDSRMINRCNIDFLILDEAQRIKNFTTKTHSAIRSIQRKHALAITGTPLENKLLDLYAITTFLDQYFLTPLWEFSYQHCVFDPSQRDKILGYYNLNALKNRMQKILLRREKRMVLKELPNIRQIDVPVSLSAYQSELHAGYASGVSQILSKKFRTPFDMQMLMHLLTNMRMVCDSSALVDDKSADSPKLAELEHTLTEKFDLPNSGKKIIIFSEWVKMNKLIGQMLRSNDIGFIELNGTVPVKKRGALIRKFETDKDLAIFLSTEAGGAGLNLQVADTVINFELPWNPAKKNQRIGRVDRLGQKSAHLTVINFITQNSIEQKIAGGLLLKQNLFEGVLDPSTETDTVDFSEKGKSQFLKQIEQMVEDLPQQEAPVESGEDEFSEEGETLSAQTQLFREEDTEKTKTPTTGNRPSKAAPATPTEAHNKIKEMEAVMNQGMGFLAGLYKMSTGQDMGAENQKIEVDEKTGEVTMKFKLPGFK